MVETLFLLAVDAVRLYLNPESMQNNYPFRHFQRTRAIICQGQSDKLRAVRGGTILPAPAGQTTKAPGTVSLLSELAQPQAKRVHVAM